MLWPTFSGVHSIPAIHQEQKQIEGFEPQGSTLIEAWQYVTGNLPPRYPVPATEFDSALAASLERVTPLVKLMLLQR